MLAAMPADVLYKIFIHLEVIDLVRLQQVSSRFLDIIDERNVWSDAYRKSSLPSSRGPFVWQSSAYLRSALITSAKLKRTWPTRSAWLKKIPARDIMFTETLRHFQLLLGRWLIVVISDGEKQVCCYDLDSEDEKPKKHVIYHVPSGADVAYLGCTDVATTDGQFAFVAFMHRTVYDEENEGTLKVYKLTSETSSPVCFELVLELCRGPRWPHIQIAPQVLLIVGRTTPDNYHNKTWIMDIRTNRVYKLPPAKDRPTEMAAHADRLPVKIFVGTTHIFVMHVPTSSLAWDERDLVSFVEAYPLRALDQGYVSTTDSRPSHRSLLPYKMYVQRRWSAHDTSDGGSTITITAGIGSHVVLVRLTLAPPPFPAINVGQIRFDASILEGLAPSVREPYCDSFGSDNLNRRVLSLHTPGRKLHEFTFFVDETGKRFRARVTSDGESAMHVPGFDVRYDEARGRICVQLPPTDAGSAVRLFSLG